MQNSCKVINVEFKKVADYSLGFSIGKKDMMHQIDRSNYILKHIEAEYKQEFITGYLNSQGRSIKDFNSDLIFLIV